MISFRHEETGEVHRVPNRQRGAYLAEDGWREVKDQPIAKMSAIDKRRAALRSMDRADFYDEIMAEIEALRERVRRLEK